MDRNYNNDNTLVSRTKANAIINSSELMFERINSLINNGYLISAFGKRIFLEVDTFCIHGDSPNILDCLKGLNNCIMQKFKINFFRYSLDSILVNWPAKISIEISTQINSFSNAILKNPNILELRKGYCSLLIIFKTEIDNYEEICNSLLEIHRNLKVFILQKISLGNSSLL